MASNRPGTPGKSKKNMKNKKNEQNSQHKTGVFRHIVGNRGKSGAGKAVGDVGKAARPESRAGGGRKREAGSSAGETTGPTATHLQTLTR